jgi:hypothetical protein
MAAIVPNFDGLIKLIGLIDGVDSSLDVPETDLNISMGVSFQDWKG